MIIEQTMMTFESISYLQLLNNAQLISVNDAKENNQNLSQTTAAIRNYKPMTTYSHQSNVDAILEEEPDWLKVWYTARTRSTVHNSEFRICHILKGWSELMFGCSIDCLIDEANLAVVDGVRKLDVSKIMVVRVKPSADPGES
ncbi:hypothetical protein WICPIJ_004561 [Wickerhamomyces pijperi]|uniref:Uncharacterized protein n=1 Tax=Wickerhamomyces pijperi TaxID=599730 RepID=A0A9P8Q549_WICPI|nr:hypothetical protein WICPIJ_004561 [Wickerhamomyces pijperi]